MNVTEPDQQQLLTLWALMDSYVRDPKVNFDNLDRAKSLVRLNKKCDGYVYPKKQGLTNDILPGTPRKHNSTL